MAIFSRSVSLRSAESVTPCFTDIQHAEWLTAIPVIHISKFNTLAIPYPPKKKYHIYYQNHIQSIQI